VARDQALEVDAVEQRTRNALERCESLLPRVGLSRQAQAAARESFALVRGQYVEGVVNVTDVTSAQVQALAADQLAVAAVNEMLLDLVDLQRSLAWLEHEHDPAEQAARVERVLEETGRAAGPGVE
jgi:outer membrane protein TolC